MVLLRVVSGGSSISAVATRAAVGALVAVVIAFAGPTLAPASLPPSGLHVAAPALAAGPVITRAGLVWENTRGIMLTGRAGGATVLARRDAPNWNGEVDLAWFGQDWWVLARPSGVFGGRVGGALAQLPMLRRCNPATRSASSAADGAIYAVAGDHLFAAEPQGCFTRRSEPAGRVVEVDLRSRRARVLASVPGSIAHVAAAGRYLAVAYLREAPRSPSQTGPAAAEPRLLVRLLDAATGAVIGRVAPPSNAPQFEREGADGVQVDEHGDVLVTAGCCGASSGRLAHTAQPRQPAGWWWARAGSRVGRDVSLGKDAALSDGRVAFLSSNAGRNGASIDVKNLLDGGTRTVVNFSGSAGAASLALEHESLAWAQQSTVIDVTSSVHAYSCAIVPLGPVELARLNLRTVPPTPVVVTGAPIPPRYANEPACIRA